MIRPDRFEEAISKLSESISIFSNENRSVATAFLAMAQARVGRSDEAQQWLDKAAKQREETLQEKPNASVTPLDPPVWESRLKSELLLAEAKRQVQR